LSTQSVQANESAPHIEVAPDWVKQRELSLADKIPVDEINNGVFYQLVDNQIHVSRSGVRTSYSRYAESIVNQIGLETSSQINLEFDPSYQKLTLNTLTIFRDGQPIDKLTTAKVAILSNEKELDDQTYNGYLTMNILIDDLREGDTLDYSYTRYGTNPIYQGVFSTTRTLNWSVPVYNQYIRILWGKSNPLHIHSRNIEPNIEEKKLGNFTEYQIQMHDTETINSSSQTPDWYDPYGTVYFTETESWKDVVNWAKPLYSFNKNHADVITIANDIRKNHSDRSDQIFQALKYVQDHIRYVALQMGINSHLPTPAHETLALRYGDCKDKTVLLISILSALGIESSPALVDTEETKLLLEKPPAYNRFDHVLVTLLHKGKRVWLDPTLRFQQGPFSNLYQPDYGYALIIKSGQNSLTSMSQEKKNSYTHISEQYFIPKGLDKKVTLKVVSDYFGNKARYKYSQIEEDGKNKLSKDYEIYYQRTYPNLVMTSEIDITNNQDTGVLTLAEQYLIEGFWIKKDNNYEVDFYPTDIRNAVFKPKQTKRNAPLFLTYPNNIRNQIKITFEEENWKFKNEEFIEDNAYFFFKEKVNFENNTLTLNYEYSAKVDHVPAEKIDTYIAARKLLRTNTYYGIMKYGENTNIVENESADETSANWVEIIGLAYLLAFGAMIISWRMESRSRPDFANVNFYPISLSKFLTLSIVTLGTYDAYWMYRNWKAIKQRQGIEIIPIARGFFTIFWFFPLFNQLKEDSIERFNKNKVVATYLAVIFAILYFLVSVIYQRVDHYILTLLVLLLPLIFIPFQNYINSINADDMSCYHYNSKWCIRNTMAVLMFTPLLGFTLISESSLLPSDGVVTQESIMARDMKFLYRKKIVPLDEEINYFYSDAFLSIRDDGNGFTDKRIFSYWLEENDQFESEIVTFDKVKDIKVKYADDEASNTIITVTRTDDSEFMLFVSVVDEGDKLFVKKLKALWKNKVNI